MAKSVLGSSEWWGMMIGVNRPAIPTGDGQNDLAAGVSFKAFLQFVRLVFQEKYLLDDRF
jgi:hypothetical protein